MIYAKLLGFEKQLGSFAHAQGEANASMHRVQQSLVQKSFNAQHQASL